MSKTSILVVCAFAGAIILGTTTKTPAAPGNGIPPRVAALEAAVASLADQLAEHDHDSDYSKTPGEALSIVRGVVASSGAIISGDGFTVSYLGGGRYRVNFDADAFHGGVAPLVQALGPAPESAYVVTPVGAAGFGVQTKSGNPQSFRFVALGVQ